MGIRIGEVLVQHGLLNKTQVDAVLEQQQASQRPFGVIAEEMFHLHPEDVEFAWAHQYAQICETVTIREETIDPDAMQLIDRRQAWQFRICPLRFCGGELMIATTVEHLARALRFISRCIELPCYLVLAEASDLGEALVEHFPMAGMTPESVMQSAPPASRRARRGA